jgi:iduronate 2-sulfatase
MARPVPLLALLAVLGASPGEGQSVRKLNVLFIVSDDLNVDLGAYGAPVKTPHIDRLAARGVRFERAYCQFPLCNPSRSSFLTGRRPDVTGVLRNPAEAFSPHFRERLPDTTTLPQLFKSGGWFSARVGKLYHYGVPAQIGTASLDDYPSWDLAINPRGRDREVQDRIFSVISNPWLGPLLGRSVTWLADEGADDEQTDGIAAAEAVRLLERFAREKRPFFLGVGFYRPHTPWVAPKKYFALYPRDRMEPPKLSSGDRARKPEPAYHGAYPEEDAMTDEQRRQGIQAYRASTTFMDAQVGHLLDALDRLGLSANTAVVFTSDHGYHLADHGLWHKMSLFERSARVPLIVAAPGWRGNGRAAAGLVELVDLYPTLASLAGLQAPDYLDGKSLVPMLDDPTASVKDAAFTQLARRGYTAYSVRTARWRYVEWDEGRSGVQLYDMEQDPGETTNLARDASQASTLAELKTRLQQYRGRNRPAASERPPTGLVGTWTKGPDSLLRLRFAAPGRWAVLTTGTILHQGPYTTRDGQLTLGEDEGSCVATGLYGFNLKDDTLVLDLAKDDDCPARGRSLAGTYVRVEK